MALIACYECGRQISTEATSCPQCGAPKKRPFAPQVSTTGPGFSDLVREGLDKLAEVSTWHIVAWVGFGLFIPTAIFGRNPLGLLFAFVCGVISFRAWCGRRTARLIVKLQNLDSYATRVYLPALWSYAWRSCVTFVAIAFLLGFFAFETVQERGVAIGAVIGMWLFPSLFVVDVPFWIYRRLHRIVPPTIAVPRYAEHSTGYTCPHCKQPVQFMNALCSICQRRDPK